MKNLIAFAFLATAIVACTTPEKKVRLSNLVEAVTPFVERIDSFESKKNLQNIEEFMALGDSISKETEHADSIIANLFLTIKDTLYLPFEQVENKKRIEIQKVWVVGAKYNELLIEAQVKGLDASKMAGPYTSVSAFNKKGENLNVGGGIGASSDVKLQIDSVYIFTGRIDNLHKLDGFKTLKFDEDIKKW